jgi:hypothetical protein
MQQKTIKDKCKKEGNKKAWRKTRILILELSLAKLKEVTTTRKREYWAK